MVGDYGAMNEPPLPEAYSRVTDPGRFRPLHALAVALLDELEATYDVVRTAAFDPPPGLTSLAHIRPPVRLAPVDAAAAPIAVAFTPFPSLLVHCGRGLVESFPTCGCDACRETVDGEAARLRALIADVVAGRFGEQITIPSVGEATVAWEVGSLDAWEPYWSGGSKMAPEAARRLLGSGRRRIRWQPWPSRWPRPPQRAPAV